jgi:hypothetical protein
MARCVLPETRAHTAWVYSNDLNRGAFRFQPKRLSIPPGAPLGGTIERFVSPRHLGCGR